MVAIAIIVAITMGLQLGSMRWKHRKLIWQLQAALMAGSVGFATGFVSGKLQGPDQNNH
ncbi:MAG: hypothetical protein AB8E74_09980 [Prochlorococcus sp.]|nr:hypothetical protein [Prochlorococcaceae cyanobacterium Fu_MAG_50]